MSVSLAKDRIAWAEWLKMAQGSDPHRGHCLEKNELF